MDIFWQDLRHTLRTLRRSPGFAAVAMLTLAIGIGANTAIFSVVNAVLLRPLPYPGADRIVRIREERAVMRGMRMASFMTGDTLEAWREDPQTIDQVAGYSPRTYTLTGRGEPGRLRGAAVSAQMFGLLEVAPVLGRAFREEEERPGANLVVVLSNGFWRRQFQADPDIVGDVLALDESPHTIVGVLPEGFYFPDRETEVWTPLRTAVPNRRPGQIQIIAFAGLARLKQGVSLEQATAEGQTILQRNHTQMPEPMSSKPAPTLRLIPVQEAMVGEARPALLAAVAFVLLIACANLANLLLAHGASRQREMAVRCALGAGRGRLIRQLLTESTLLSLAGGMVGLLAATWIHQVLPAVAPADIPRIGEVALDRRVLGFAVALSVATGVAFGLIPALQGSRLNFVRALNEGSVQSVGGFGLLRSSRARSTFAVAEVALALVLLIGAGLLLKSFVRLIDVDPGYDPRNVLTARLNLPETRYTDAGVRDTFFDQLLERIDQLPGVDAAGVVSFLPLAPGEARTILQIAGRPQPTRIDERTAARPQVVSGGYFRAMGLQLVAGRFLTDRDDASAV